VVAHENVLVRVRALDLLTERPTNALCFASKTSSDVHVVTGPSEDLGFHATFGAHANFTWRAQPALIEMFRRYFDWAWAHSGDVTADGVTQIPELIIPEGSQQAAKMWAEYVARCAGEG